MSKLILASSSKTRKQILSKLQLPFEAIAPNIDETPMCGETPIELVKRLAVAKASKIAESYRNHFVIGSDQVAVLNGQITGKPKNKEHAIEQLSSASGRNVTLFTSLTLLNTKSGNVQTDVLQYRVKIRNLTPHMIDRYLEMDQPYDCCGSIRSEGLGITLIQEFDGSDPNILLGLPLIRLIDMLKQENFEVLSF